MVLIKVGDGIFDDCFWFDDHTYDFRIDGSPGFDSEACSNTERMLEIQRH